MSDKPQKTLWHSAAVELGQVEVVVKSEARKSKYGADKPDYVELMIGGHLRHYQVENPNCGEFFRGKVGQSILVEFRDSREQASIHAMAPAKQPTNVPPKTSPTTNQPPADTRPAPPVNQPPNNPAPPASAPPQHSAKGMRATEIRYERTLKTGN